MIKEIFFYLFVVLGLVNTIHFGFFLVGANVYDVQSVRRAAKFGKKRPRRQPLVSILIPAHNEERAIERCLQSVLASSYRNLQIIVVDDASTDSTAKIVRQFIKNNPKHNLYLLAKRKNVGKGSALNSALKTKATGELVMTLDADSVLDKNAVRNAAKKFQDPAVMAVAANVRIMDQPTMLGMLQKFEHLIGYRSKKFYSATASEFIVGGVASTYRREIVRQVGYYDTDTATEDIGLSLKVAALGNKQHRIVYGADVIAWTEGVQSYKALFAQRYRWKMGSLQNLLKYRQMLASRDGKYSKMLTFYRLPMAYFGELMLIIEPILLAYILLMSYRHHSLALFVGAYMVITGYVLLTVWPDEHTSWRAKIDLSLYAPVLYFTFYIMNVVQVTSILRCLIRPSRLLRPDITAGRWVSPERQVAKVT